MAELSKSRPVARPGANMRLIEALQYRLPLAALVSILHRASGMLMFFLLPFIVWMFDASVSSETSYDSFTSAFVAGIGVVPGVVVKLGDAKEGIIVNVGGVKASRFLKVGIVMEMNPGKKENLTDGKINDHIFIPIHSRFFDSGSAGID